MTQPVRNDLGTTTTNRKWYVDVSTDGTTWVAVMGMTEFQPNLDDATMEDDSDFDSGGYRSQTKTASGWGCSFTVRRAPTAAAPTVYDPGQELLRQAAIGTFGVANSRFVRFYEMEPGGPRVEAYQGRAAVQWAPNGGNMAALSTVAVTLQGQGELAEISHPNPAG